MEKGSFHTPRVKEVDDRVKAIALPNELPQGIDFREVPIETLKSATLESLISQNDDLMARLNVTLRRNHDLEAKLTHLEAEIKATSSRFGTLKEQYLVLSEKDKVATLRLGDLYDENLKFRTQLNKLEKLYSDLFIQAQAYQRKYARLEQYRAQIRQASRPIQKLAKKALGLEQDIEHLNKLRGQLISGYESKINEIRDQTEIWRQKAEERDELASENVKLKNQFVILERQNENSRLELQALVDTANTNIREMRQEIKNLVVERESLQSENATLKSELPNLRLEKTALTEQVESLQALWKQKDLDLERFEEKNQSLQKLNQSLAINMNQQRRELTTCRAQLDQERLENQERIKVLLSEIELLKSQRRY